MSITPVSTMQPLASPQALLAGIRSELDNPFAFTAQAHHGWGDPTPPPLTPPPATMPPSTTPAAVAGANQITTPAGGVA